MTQARHILISGIVQGVGYRAWTERTAHTLHLTGWARNLHDGRVEVWAEGSAEALTQLVAECMEGPMSAEVDDVKMVAVDPRNHTGFEIKKTAASPESLD